MTNVIHPYKSFASIQKRVRGLSVEILLNLHEFEDLNGLTCPEIAELTGKKSDYVKKYLQNLRKYGLVEKSGSLWRLTEDGRAFIMRMKRLWRLQDEE